MGKRGQLTIFVILGLIIVIAIVSLMYMSTTKKPETEISVVVPIKTFTEQCIKTTLEQGLHRVGYATLVTLEGYMNNNLKNCTDGFIPFERVEIIEGDITSEISLTDSNQRLIANVEYPLTIIWGNSTEKIKDFYDSYDLSFQAALPITDGVTQVQTVIESQDRVLSLGIQDGTEIPVDFIQISMKDKKIHPISSEEIFGNLIYDLQPEGLIFDKPAILTITYKDLDLPEGFHEQELENRYFNEVENKWVPLPTKIDVINNNLLTEITHFSEYSLGVADELNHQNQVFIVSDKDWKTVLQLVPLTTWMSSGELHKQPLLIFHEEESSFDADSLIHFLQQYNTEKATLVGETPSEFDNLLTSEKDFGAGLLDNQIQRIDPKIIIEY